MVLVLARPGQYCSRFGPFAVAGCQLESMDGKWQSQHLHASGRFDTTHHTILYKNPSPNPLCLLVLMSLLACLFVCLPIACILALVPRLSLHCLALSSRDSVFSLSLHSDIVLRGEGGREWLASHIAASGT
jgi:hypothetical protein